MDGADATITSGKSLDFQQCHVLLEHPTWAHVMLNEQHLPAIEPHREIPIAIRFHQWAQSEAWYLSL